MKEFVSKLNLGQELKDYFLISLGLMLYAVGLTCFLLPYQITTGGVTGIASIIYFATGLEVQNTYMAINILLLILGVKMLGFRFCVKTIYATLMLAFYMWAMQRIVEDPVTLKLPQTCGTQEFMACVIGACFEGIALAICFLRNGSTGGTDIIAAVVNKYRDISLGKVLMVLDIFIVSSNYFVFHDWHRVLFGFAALIISNVTLDYVMSSQMQSVQFFIISEKYDLIADEIIKTGRGVTVLNGQGWYTKRETNVLMVLVRKRESVQLFRFIKELDPAAFVSQGNVTGVYGEGFDAIKVK